MVALIKKYERTQVDRGVNPVAIVAPQTSAGELAAGIADVGDMFANWQDEIDTSDAKMADTDYSNVIREQLYGDESGFMYSQGGDSINRRNGVSAALEEEQQRILGELSPAARARAKNSMAAQYQRALQNVDSHTATQRTGYLNEASTARITSTVQNAIYDPSMVSQSLKTMNEEISDLADRNGWSPEKTSLERQMRTTEIHSGIIDRLEVVSPSMALDYLRENKGAMTGEAVAEMERMLIPAARAESGRKAGAAAALVPNEDWLEYANAGAKRSEKISPELTQSLSFVGDMGLTMKVISGGQKSKAQLRKEASDMGLTGKAVNDYISKHNTGSDRHNHGGSVDADFYKNGRRLDWNNPEDMPIFKEIVRRARAAGVTGIGGADDYMGAGRLHLGGGVEAAWGRDGKGEHAPEWLTSALADTSPLTDIEGGGGGLEALLEIQDPDERAAAIQEYELRTAVRNKQEAEAKDAAGEAAYELILNGGNVNSLPVAQQKKIGMGAMSSLNAYQRMINEKGKVDTVDQVYVELSTLAASDPKAFMAENPMDWLTSLDKGDFQYFTKLRSQLIAGERSSTIEAASNRVTMSQIRTASSTALKAAGLDDESDAGWQFESDMLRWADEFSAREKRTPSEVEINSKVNSMVLSVSLDPKGLSNRQRGSVFELNYGGETLSPNDDITPSMLLDGALTLGDQKVSNEVLEEFRAGFYDYRGRQPTVKELIEGLAATGIY